MVSVPPDGPFYANPKAYPLFDSSSFSATRESTSSEGIRFICEVTLSRIHREQVRSRVATGTGMSQ